MKEKVTFNYANGETSEKALIAHFKSIDDLHPNIKNLPVMVIDKNEFNNGNKVLEFYYQKDGLYQPIIDDASWKETKGVITDIIKNNFKMTPDGNETTYLVSVEGNTFMANVNEGKLLALTETQVASLENHFNAKLETINNQSNVVANPNEISEVAEPLANDIALAPAPEIPPEAITNPVNNDINLINPVAPAVSDSVMPEAEVVPPATPIINEPVLNDSVAPVVADTPVISDPVAPAMDLVAPVVGDALPVTPAIDEPVAPPMDAPLFDTPQLDENTISETPQIDLNQPVTDIPVVGGVGSEANVTNDNFLIQDDGNNDASVFDLGVAPVVEEPVNTNPLDMEPLNTVPPIETNVTTEDLINEVSPVSDSNEDRIRELDKQINDLMIEKMRLLNEIANK